MGDARIPVDLLNPGQVFACMGFLEAADILLGDAEGGFDWTDETNVCFRLRASGEKNPFGVVLRSIVSAEANWISPSSEINERDGGKTLIRAGIAWSSEPSAADLPAELFAGNVENNQRHISLGFWADGSGRFNTTFKKSTNGASSHVRFQNGLIALREIAQHHFEQAMASPLNSPARTESLFRLDPRSYADPLNAGFSADKLRKGSIDVRFETYPICEILAVIGLEHSRPAKISSQEFRYYAWGFDPNTDDGFLPPVLGRGGLGTPISFLPHRCFTVAHQEVKRGGDRKIISTKEETNP